MRVLMIAIILSCCTVAASFAGNIGYGTIKGIKIGNGNADQVIVYLNDGYTHDDHSCSGAVIIEKSLMSETRFNLLHSYALSAYMANKKARFYSHSNNCNATFIGLQEEYF